MNTVPEKGRLGRLALFGARIRSITTASLRVGGRLARHETTRNAILGLPALLVALGVLLSLPWLRSQPAELRNRYEFVAEHAQATRDGATANVCLDRLLLLKRGADAESAEFTERLGRLALDLDQPDQADVLLAAIAPEDRPVHAPAHLLRALLLLRPPTPGRGVSRANRVRAERHLRSALALSPEMPEAHEVLARIAVQDGDLAAAEGHMEHAARAHPGLSYEVASIMERRGRTETAAFWARQAQVYFAHLSTNQPEDHQSRIGWASSEVLLGNFEEARAILRRGLDRADRADYHRAMAKAYLTEAIKLASRGNSNPAQRWPLLEGALNHDPENPALIEQVAAALQVRGVEADHLRGQLQSLLTQGRALTTAHLLLGHDAWERQRIDEARLHWERALAANPRSAVVANNLAWALANGSNTDLPRALMLIDGVLTLQPSEPNLLGTKGRILVRLNRWKDALEALEASLAAQPENRDLHADLAEVYSALKAPELAEQHRQWARSQTPGEPR